MQSEVSLSKFKQFPPLMWILLIGAFITRGSFYMVWPFLAVILYEKFGISATEVGLILSAAAFISVFVGFIGGALSDRFGRHQLMYGSGILYVISFSMLAEVDSIIGYVLVITLCSIAKAIWEPPTSALIADIIPDSKTRELAMQSRYFIVNVGAAIGPMVGVWFGLTGQQSSFYITAGAFALLLVLLRTGFKRHGKISSGHENTPQQLKQTIGVLKQDRLLQCLIVANILCMLIYAQMDTSLIQYLNRANVPSLLELISSLILTNALVIICSQFLLLKMMASLSLEARIQIGLVLLAISQFWLAINPLELFWGWVGAIAIMSIAEAILFPTMNVHIDRLAPAHLRGAYFGAASFYSIGYALAPFLGGLVLDHLGGFWLFAGGSLMCLLVIYLYSILHKLPRPGFVTETQEIV
ncbi:MDR family MFS transporter [Colwelliaceae bacterium 6471]